MELREFLRVLRKNVLLIIATILAGSGAAAAFSLAVTPQFEAGSTIFVSTQTASSVQELNQGSNFTAARVESYVSLVSTPVVLDPVITQLQLPLNVATLNQRISAESPASTTLIQITVRDPDPGQAAAIANAVASSLTTVVERIETPTRQTVSPVKLALVRAAAVPQKPVSPNVPINIALGLGLGMLIGLGIALLRRVLDNRINTVRDLSEVSEVPLIGSVAYDSKAAEHPLIVHMDPRSARSESFRSLRTNLQFVDIEGAHSFLVASSIPGEGKSTTAVNLAIALADAGERVVLVDADLRRPKIYEYMGIEGGAGLTDVLIGQVALNDVLQRWGTERLDVLPAGKSPPNPSELLSSRAMAQLVAQLEEDYDIVIFDTPPLLPVTDAAVLAKRVGSVIMVVAAGRTTRNQLAGSLASLKHVGAHVAGLVLSMVPTKGPDAYGYGYGYAYGYGPETGAKGALTVPSDPLSQPSSKASALPEAASGEPVTIDEKAKVIAR